jgi:prophage regulatory protein
MLSTDTAPELTLPEDLPKFGFHYSNTHLRRLEGAGKFPKRVHLSPRKHAYVTAELRALAKARIAERDAPKAA